jgi:hypothetical protein
MGSWPHVAQRALRVQRHSMAGTCPAFHPQGWAKCPPARAARERLAGSRHSMARESVCAHTALTWHHELNQTRRGEEPCRVAAVDRHVGRPGRTDG